MREEEDINKDTMTGKPCSDDGFIGFQKVLRVKG